MKPIQPKSPLLNEINHRLSRGLVGQFLERRSRNWLIMAGTGRFKDELEDTFCQILCRNCRLRRTSLQVDCCQLMQVPVSPHLTARVLREMPDADVNLLRALLIAHARVPGTTSDLLEGNAARIRRICGYGKIEDDALFASVEENLTLWASDRILNKTHHFYDLPIPESLFAAGSSRRREVTIALAHTPPTRTTRIDYKASRIRFRLIQAESLEDATAAFNAATNDEEWENISELSGNKSISDRDRSKGSVQSTTWTMQRPSHRHRGNGLYLVVTRHDPAWGEAITDEEEKYSIVIIMRDREAENAQLYTQVRAILRARQRSLREFCVN